MKLLLDIGNTRIKWAWWDGSGLRDDGDIFHLDQSGERIMAFLDGFATVPAAVLAANVAGPSMATALADGVERRWRLPVQFAASQPESGGVRNGYEDYRQLGVDRWLAIVAAYRHVGGPVCVVDAGTAVTVDQVDGAGRHWGGLIVPSARLMERALDQDTGDIRRLREWTTGGSMGGNVARSTNDAIRVGSHLAITCLIERCVEILRQDCGEASLVITGGDAEVFLDRLGETAEHRPLLVLEGLAAELG